MVVAVVLGIVFAIVLADDGPNTKYSEYGITYYLPDEYEEKNVSYAAKYYRDKNSAAGFMLQAFTRSYIETEATEDGENDGLGLDPDITVEEYTRYFLALNGYKNTETHYDEETGKMTFKINYVDELEGINEWDYYTIFRNHDYLYIAMFFCEDTEVEAFDPLFGELSEKIEYRKS